MKMLGKYWRNDFSFFFLHARENETAHKWRKTRWRRNLIYICLSLAVRCRTENEETIIICQDSYIIYEIKVRILNFLTGKSNIVLIRMSEFFYVKIFALKIRRNIQQCRGMEEENFGNENDRRTIFRGFNQKFQELNNNHFNNRPKSK